MKKRPTPQEGAKCPDSAKFSTANPRHLRAIAALMRRSLPREHLDREAGCSNGPELIAELRRRGLEVPCVRIDAFDRDGRPCKPGVYHMTESDRRKVNAWLRQRGQLDSTLAGLVALAIACAILLIGIV